MLAFPRSTLYAQAQRETAKVAPLHRARRGQKPSVSDADLLSAMRADLESSPSTSEGHRKLWARLRIVRIRIETIDESWVWVFSAVDHFDACCVGIHVAKTGNRFAALQPIAQGSLAVRWTCADARRGLALRMDHGTHVND